MYSRNTITTNEPTASNNKSDRPYVSIQQIADIFFNKDYYHESYILIIAHSSVVTVAEWLDGSFEK
jgi:hypothetical protein